MKQYERAFTRHLRDPDGPRHILSAKALDPSKVMDFTGETVGGFSHRQGAKPVRKHPDDRSVSTLTDHVVRGKAERTPGRVETERERIKRIARETGRKAWKVQR